MLELLEKKYNVKIISVSQKPASDGCDFAFSTESWTDTFC